MNKFLYPKLAAQNMRKNARFFFPYLLTILGTAASFYIMAALASDPGVADMRGASYVQFMMWTGIWIAALFAAIFLFYTNSFLMKRRKKELGLYNILGMGKRNIARILCFETLYTILAGVGGGIAAGIVFHKLVLLLLFRLLRFPVPFGFSVSVPAIRVTFILFGVILLLTLLSNLRKIHSSNPIELLRGSNTGEREPRTKWLLTLLGLLCLGAGYGIALTTKSSTEALMLYFVAVFFVIVGTYCLFTAVSITVLKLLRKKKQFYYRTSHFITISGMLYRMKQNAVGLANICILSTMVLVMLSGTVSLYLGTEDVIDAHYPGEIMTTVRYGSESGFDAKRMEQKLVEELEKSGRTVERFCAYRYLSFGAGRTANGVFTTDYRNENAANVALCFLTAADYAKVTGTKPMELELNQVLFYAKNQKAPDQIQLRFVSQEEGGKDADLTFYVAGRTDGMPAMGELMSYIVETCYFVVADESVLTALYDVQKQAYGKQASLLTWEAQADIDGTQEDSANCAERLNSADSGIDWSETGHWDSLRAESRSNASVDLYAMNGGFLFLGILLGFLFIMAAVLIIYYKQISEGYEDKERFEIMQKVGLTKKEVRRSINAQVLAVFFLPLVVAAIHVVFDFRMMLQLLNLFALQNTTLTLLCTGGTLVVFILLYSLVYALTARSYYKIVSGRTRD